MKTEISKSFIFRKKKPLGEICSKITFKFPKNFLFRKKPAKSEMLRSRHSHRLEIAKNYTIFKALGKKSGSRKQVHLWQISKVCQLQYYLIKILQDNAFFTRLKKHPKIPICSIFMNNEKLRNFKGKNYGLVH